MKMNKETTACSSAIMQAILPWVNPDSPTMDTKAALSGLATTFAVISACAAFQYHDELKDQIECLESVRRQFEESYAKVAMVHLVDLAAQFEKRKPSGE
jgi:hypothetical protein